MDSALGTSTVYFMGTISRNLGELAETFGDRATAIELLREALPRNRSIGARPDVALTSLGLARLLPDGNRAERAEAAALAQDALDLATCPRLRRRCRDRPPERAASGSMAGLAWPPRPSMRSSAWIGPTVRPRARAASPPHRRYRRPQRGPTGQPGGGDEHRFLEREALPASSVAGHSLPAASSAAPRSATRSAAASMPTDRRSRSSGTGEDGPSMLRRCSMRLPTPPSEVARLNTRTARSTPRVSQPQLAQASGKRGSDSASRWRASILPGLRWHYLGQGAVGLSPVTDADDQDDELSVGDLINDPIVANT
jgi:hypothetical protein